MKKDIPPKKKFGRLTVIEKTNLKKHSCYLYKCKCSCDNKEVLVRSDHLRSGEVQSCGCLHDYIFQKNRLKAYEKNFVFKTSIPKIESVKLQNNNTSGATGVRWHKRIKKWQASINFKGVTYNLGYYIDIEDAKKARNIAKQNLHGDFLEYYAKRKQ